MSNFECTIYKYFFLEALISWNQNIFQAFSIVSTKWEEKSRKFFAPAYRHSLRLSRGYWQYTELNPAAAFPLTVPFITKPVNLHRSEAERLLSSQLATFAEPINRLPVPETGGDRRHRRRIWRDFPWRPILGDTTNAGISRFGNNAPSLRRLVHGPCQLSSRRPWEWQWMCLAGGGSPQSLICGGRD